MKTIVALFDHPRTAEHAVRDLLVLGLTDHQLNVVSPADPGAVRRRQLHLEDEHDPDDELLESTPTDGVSTTVSIGGLLLSAAFLTVPAVGLVLAAGPLLAGMAGAGSGAGIEDLPHRLAKAGVPALDADRYARTVHHGGTLVVVTANDGQVEDVASRLARHEPIEPDELGVMRGVTPQSTLAPHGPHEPDARPEPEGAAAERAPGPGLA